MKFSEIQITSLQIQIFFGLNLVEITLLSYILVVKFRFFSEYSDFFLTFIQILCRSNRAGLSDITVC